MLAFYSNRVGCIGSIVVSLLGSTVLLFLMQSCAADERVTSVPIG